MAESKFSISGFENGIVGFEPAGIVPPDKPNFGEESACPVAGSIPSIVATAGSITPAGPVAAVVGAPQVKHVAVLGDKKLAMSVWPGTFWLPRTRLRNAVRW